MACGGPLVGRAGGTFRFCLTSDTAVCAGQRVTTDTATRGTVGEPVRYTDEELRQCVEWPLEQGRLYNLLLLCVPPGAAVTARITIEGETFEDQCTAGANGSVGPWLVFVAPPPAAAQDEAPTGGGLQ